MKSFRKVLIVKSVIPKYDYEFYQKLSLAKEFELYVTSDTLKKNQLNTDISLQKSFHSIHTRIVKIGPFIYTVGLQKIINKIKPNVIVFASNPRDIGLLFFIALNKYIYHRKIVTWSMYHRIGGEFFFSRFIHKLAGKMSDRNMSYTNIGAKCQNNRGIPLEKIDVIGTAIDEKKIFQIQSGSEGFNKEAFLNKYDLKGKFILLQVLRLSAIKKPNLLVDMMRLLVKSDSSIRLILIGGGDLEDKLKLNVRDSNLESYFIFVGPMYDEIELSNWFNVAKIFVVPTCIGLSAHHAFCYGLPIITDNSKTNQASEFDILQDEYNCLLYKEGDMLSFSERILQLKNNEELYKKISNNALMTVKKVHTLENKVINFISSINRVFK